MSADDDDRIGEAPIEAPFERCRRAIAFLQRARDLPELTPAQIDRIERRLQQPRTSTRHPLLSPALAALFVLLMAGGALAMAGRDLTWLPGIGRWLDARPARQGAPATRDGAHAPRVVPAPQAAMTPEPARPAPADNAPAIDDRTLEAAHERAPEARVGLTAAHHAPTNRPSAETAASPQESPPAPEPARPEPAFVPAPPAAAPAAALTQPPATPSVAATPSLAATRSIDRGTTSPSRPEPAPISVESAIVAESRSFGSALELWHRDRDAGAALAALDAHERRFPSGQIRIEARLLRTEILLASGRDGEALALLDQLALAGLPRARELRTVRGELRIKLGRCAEGKTDLQAVLASDGADVLAERARRAIAACP